MTTKTDNEKSAIKSVLEKLYIKYNHHKLIKPDPLQFVYNFTEPEDMEIAGLISAALAYGRVEQIQNSLTRLFQIIGESPYEFVLNFNSAKRNKLRKFKHRFNTGDDIADLATLLKRVLKKYSCILRLYLWNIHSICFSNSLTGIFFCTK